MKLSIRRFLCLIFLLLLSNCSDSPAVVKEPTGRIVLAEDFSFARCTYCPYAEHALDSLFKEFSDSLAVLIYHMRKLGDTLSPADVAVRESLYQIVAAPTVVFDGVHIVQTEDPSQNYQVYKNYITSRRSVTPVIRLHIETEIVYPMVSSKIHIVTTDSTFYENLRLFLVLYEDSVYFYQPGGTDTIFYFVVRKMIPDANGLPVQLTYPDSLIEELDFNLSPNWNTDKLGLVAFIQDMASREVAQAVVKKRIKAQ